MSQEGILDIISAHPEIPTQFNANVGFAVPALNELNIFGSAILQAGNPVHTVGSGNTITTEVQYSTISPVSNANLAGIASFNSADFTVDANGFVTFTGSSAAETFTLQSGFTPIAPVANNIIFNGQVITNNNTPVITSGTAPNIMNLEVQLAAAAAASNANFAGLASFNNTEFTVDANGFVSLVGGGSAIEKVNLDTGTSPIVPLAGAITLTGATVAAGTHPIRTNGTGANTGSIQVQFAQALAATDATKVGLANFDSAAFDVDANGFVQLNGGGIALTSITVDANTAPGTNPVVPTAAGGMTIEAAAVAAHSVPIETRSRAANTFKVEVQEAAAVASTDATKSGIAHFDSAFFSVDANGFVTAAAPLAFAYTTVNHAQSPYTVLSTDYYLAVDTSAGVVSLLFPNAPTTKRLFIIKDKTGTASTSAITLTTVGGAVNIDGATSQTMTSTYAAVNLLFNAVSYERY